MAQVKSIYGVTHEYHKEYSELTGHYHLLCGNTMPRMDSKVWTPTEEPVTCQKCLMCRVKKQREASK